MMWGYQEAPLERNSRRFTWVGHRAGLRVEGPACEIRKEAGAMRCHFTSTRMTGPKDYQSQVISVTQAIGSLIHC